MTFAVEASDAVAIGDPPTGAAAGRRLGRLWRPWALHAPIPSPIYS